MDAQDRKLLEAFDVMARGPLGVLNEGIVALAAVGDPETLRPVAEQMVERGWLRRGEARDTYTRTEDGRLAIAGPLEVTVYSRPGCHLCDEAKALMRPMIEQAGATLREVNIDEDPALRERYNAEVPVIFLGPRKAAKHRVDAEQFRRQLRDARRNPKA